MKRIISLLLCVCLVAALTGCGNPYRDSLLIPVTTQPDTTPDATDETVYPVTYALTQEDVDSFYSLLEESERLALESTDLDEVDEITDRLEDKYEFLEDQCSVSQILYYCDMSDEAASERYLDCVDMLTQANNAYMEMVRRVYQSDAPAKEMLFEGWTQEELDMLMAYSDEIMELEKRNSELVVAYQALEDPASDDMIPLYGELVRNNNRMAQIYGFENYYEFAYQVSYGRDYDSTQLEKMRQYASQYLSGIYENAYMAYAQAHEELSFVDGLKLSSFMSDPYDDCGKAYFTTYLDSLPETLGQGMKDAIDSGHTYFAQSDDAYGGAFTTTIGEESFCFFGPDYSNSLTVAHELGHYYGSQFGDLDVMPLDLAETQSQGNEWLFLGQLQEQMEPELYAAVLNYKMYSDLCTILVCVIVDEFEQRIYSEPELESFTAQDFNRVMEQVCQRYGGLEYISYWVTDIQSYWRYVVMESPVYYISYGVSAIAAMNLYTIYQEDPDRAVEAYRAVTESQEELGFLETIEAAGLPGPFDESVYENLVKMYSEIS